MSLQSHEITVHKEALGELSITISLAHLACNRVTRTRRDRRVGNGQRPGPQLHPRRRPDRIRTHNPVIIARVYRRIIIKLVNVYAPEVALGQCE